MRQKTRRCGRHSQTTLVPRTSIVIGPPQSTMASADCPQGRLCRFSCCPCRVRALTSPRADKFDVTLSFLLQQAAWLYERQLSQVRAQMRKVGRDSASTPEQKAGPSKGSPENVDHKRKDSKGIAQHASTSTTTKLITLGQRRPSFLHLAGRDRQSPAEEGSQPATPVARGM